MKYTTVSCRFSKTRSVLAGSSFDQIKNVSRLYFVILHVCARVCLGLGYTMFGISILVSIYYNVLLAYTIYYFCVSFTSVLPWSECGSWCSFPG